MTPHSITLMGFKCFAALTTFQFPTAPGLYFVTGRNEVNAELEANACGKSTLFCDAISWCLYGKTPRGVKAGDVINWDASSAKGEFSFESKGVNYRVQRGQHPNFLSVNINEQPAVNVLQPDLDKLIGLDYAAFCNSIIFSQLTDTFFDLRPAEKSEVLESVLPLAVWDLAGKKAKQQVDLLNKTASKKAEEIAGLKGQLLALSELDLDDKIREWEAVRDQEILENQESIAEIGKKCKELKEKGKLWQEKESEAKHAIAEIEELLAEAEAEYEAIYAEIIAIEKKAATKTTESGMIEKELARLKQWGPVCTVCKQEIGREHKHSEETKQQNKLSRSKKELTAILSGRIEVEQRLKAVGLATGEIKNARNNWSSTYNDAARKLNEVKITVSQLLDDKKRKESRILALETRENPFVAQKKKIEVDKRKLKAQIIHLNSELKEVAECIDHAQYWVQGFKEVSLMMVSDILTQLELEVNNYLYSFGLHDWKIEFSVDSVTKTGKARKGFAVTIKPPHAETSVPWNSYSGGETQRLRLAGALGLSDLILACFGLTPGLEVWDEPSQFLTTQGVHDLVQALRERALSTSRQIFLIDHRNLDTGKFDGIYTVVKTTDKTLVSVS